MTAFSSMTTAALMRIGEVTNRTLVLPIVIFFPTSRCNSRCRSCAWWKSSGADDLTLAEIGELARSLGALGTKLVAFSGGEPLVRPDVFEAAALFRREGIALHLLTSGIGLEPRAADVARWFDQVVVSLDGTTETRYHDVRGIAALSAVEAGVTRLKALAPRVRTTARATLHKLNFRELPHLIVKARDMKLDGISFLAADTGSDAFGHRLPGEAHQLFLDRDDVIEFREIVDACIEDYRADFASKFIAESPAKLRTLPQHYAAMIGEGPFPAASCNAPWVSAVVEANGDVRPCFFQPVVGNLRAAPLATIAGSRMRAFRAGLDVSTDETCRRCVCSIKVGWRRQPWH